MIKITTIIGTLSTIFCGIWAFIQIYNKIFKPSTKLGFKYNEIEIFNDKYELLFKKLTGIKYTYEIELTTKFIDNTGNILTENCDNKNVIAYNYEFINIGKTNIKGEDFYPAERLGIKSNSEAFGVMINKKTQDYINAKIIKFDNNKIEIDFDTIKPNDSLCVTVLSTDMFNINIPEPIGKTDKINKIIPLDLITMKKFRNNLLNIIQKESLYIKESFKIYKESCTWIIFLILILNFFVSKIIQFIINLKVIGG